MAALLAYVDRLLSIGWSMRALMLNYPTVCVCKDFSQSLLTLGAAAAVMEAALIIFSISLGQFSN